MRVRLSLLWLALPCLLCAITHEDVWLMKRPDTPVPSPDGRWVVFGLTEPSYDEAAQVTDLWIVPADGSGKPRKLTNTKAAESGVTWSPDSKRLAFSARREGDETNQVYILDIGLGGEAWRASNVSTGAFSPKFSPDSRSLLFESNVYPGAADDDANRRAAAERKARKYQARVFDSFPVRAWDKWLSETQRHVFVQPLEPQGKARDLLAGSKLATASGFAGASTSGGGQELQAVWSPDSQSVVITATDVRDRAAYQEVKTDLYRVPLAGEPAPLTRGANSYSKAQFSPDGKTLYCEVEEGGERIYSVTRIGRLNARDGGPVKILNAAFDRSVSSFQVSPGGRTLYLLAEDAGLEKLYSLSADGGPVQDLEEGRKGGVLSGLAIPSRAPSTLVFANYESATTPPELVRVDARTGERSRLTELNTERAARLELAPLRHFWFTSSRGKKIHNMLVLPAAFDAAKKYPLFVVIHGGPHSAWKDQWVTRWNYHLLAQPGYVVLLTNYTGSTGFGEKFAREIQGDPLKGPAQELNEAADAAIAKFPFIDSSRQAAGGASYGGHLANWLQASTSRYKCLVAHAGLINLESQWGSSDTIYGRELMNGGPLWEGGKLWSEQNPIRFAKNFKTPMLVTVGERDYRVPLNQSLENWSVLQRMKVPSRLIVFPEENHWITKGEDSRFFYAQVQEWLAKWL